MLSLIFSFLISFSLTPAVIVLAKRLGLVDDPEKRPHPAKTHKGIIPRAGGLGIYLAILLASLFFLPLSKALMGILLGGAFAVLIGLWDDYQDLSPYFRLFTNFLTAGIVVGLGVGVPFITNPLNGIIHLDTWRLTFNFLGEHSILVWADLFALIWIVWMMNVLGWSAGVDGQLPGFVVLAAGVIAALSQKFAAHDISQVAVSQLALITAGSFLGFLPWNFYPQKIMPGYGGKSLAGFMLAVLSVLSGAKLGTAVLVLGIPVIDGLYTLGRRLLSKKSPFKADRGHLHHQLLDLGWGRRRIALFYWIITGLLGIIALNLNSQGKLFAVILLGVLIGGFLLFLKLLKFLRVPS